VMRSPTMSKMISSGRNVARTFPLWMTVFVSVYNVRKECDVSGDRARIITHVEPKKFDGIGPTTKEGIPVVLRSVRLSYSFLHFRIIYLHYFR